MRQTPQIDAAAAPDSLAKTGTRGEAPPLPPLEDEGGRPRSGGRREFDEGAEAGRPGAEPLIADRMHVAVAVTRPDDGSENDTSYYDNTGYTGRGRVRISSSESKRRIAKAAGRCFAEKGIDGTTTREIAEGAGCSEGLIYRYWPSKEALAAHLFHSVHQRLTQMFRDAIATGSAIEFQVEHLVRGYCGLADADWDLFRFHLVATPRFVPTPEGEDNPVAAAEDIVRRAMESGEIGLDEDPVVVAAMALGVMTQTALHKVYGRIEGPLSPHADTLKYGVLGVLKGRDYLDERRRRIIWGPS